ncbi:hypothetical protein [Prauserella endophytica]|uniref:DUF1648 domain-containing protein n=1 Tax=Prauserella endophytica TaxID=1592324 RepID=A0ABY2RVZ7_9PSEU|nr:hypothetical protein [Prauserella endophytica]TKG62838.1 hypothetical protein FCN18_30995 [Prauserella endophytica]
MTYGGPGQGYPQQQPGWQPQGPQQSPQPQHGWQPQGQPPQQLYPQQLPPQLPQQEPPLTLPGWGAVPAVLGIVLAALGMFALNWIDEASFAEVTKSIDQAASSATNLDGNGKLVDIYFPMGAIIALMLAAVPPAMWSLGVLRSRESIRKRGGIMKKSLSEGNTTPTRIMITVIAGLCLLYHVISLLMLTDSGEHLDQLGPGPWLLAAGAALSTLGAAIGPRVPRRPGYQPH